MKESLIKIKSRNLDVLYDNRNYASPECKTTRTIDQQIR